MRALPFFLTAIAIAATAWTGAARAQDTARDLETETGGSSADLSDIEAGVEEGDVRRQQRLPAELQIREPDDEGFSFGGDPEDPLADDDTAGDVDSATEAEVPVFSF